MAEANALTKLNHPNITRFYGVTPAPNCYIISELLECSLQDLIYSYDENRKKRKHGTYSIETPKQEPKQEPEPFPIDISLRILSDVANGCAYLHGL